MFVDSNNKRYHNFYKKFNKLIHEDKPALVNYLIFLYSEEVFLSKNILEHILKNDKWIEVSQESSMAFLSTPFVGVI